ncbi:unnamed protein product [Blepharisma stoltei]|uniref:Secreted protein n=1 Tax=Blepharisma stoltei TaxID=1481888 RepID=A0AAU9JAG8_9CILI|nr:unnamed protein product [Blepharisma stoltei]
MYLKLNLILIIKIFLKLARLIVKMVHTCQKVFDSLSLISIFGSNHFTAKILFFKHQEINTILNTKYAMTSFCENLMLIFKKIFQN